jgi:hypothetical protein
MVVLLIILVVLLLVIFLLFVRQKSINTKYLNLKKKHDILLDQEENKYNEVFSQIILHLFSDAAVNEIIAILDGCVDTNIDYSTYKKRVDAIYLTIYERTCIIGLYSPRYRERWNSISQLLYLGTELSIPHLEKKIKENLSVVDNSEKRFRDLAEKTIVKIKSRIKNDTPAGN